MAFTKETTTVVTYKLDSSKTEFNIPFDYLARDFIYVTVSTNAGNVSELTLGADYSFISDTTIKTTSVYGNSEWTLLTIRRYTSTVPVTSFINGSVLRARDLNVANIQAMHIAEEARDTGNDLIQVNTNGDFDALSKKIVNVADGISAKDAANVGQVISLVKPYSESATKAAKDSSAASAEAKTYRDEALAVVIAATDPLKAETYVVVCDEDTSNVITLKSLPISLLVIVNGIAQTSDEQYTVKDFDVTFAENSLIKGDVITFIFNQALPTV